MNSMTLDDAKALLSRHNIAFDLCEFKDEADYLNHAAPFPYARNAIACRVAAIIIRSANAKKNIELQFNAINGEFRFEDLYFGNYCYEMFDYSEKMLPDDLLKNILDIMGGHLKIISVYDLKKRRWLGDACFDLSMDDDLGEPGFQRAIKRISAKKGSWAKLIKSKKQYEIYDWNNYQSIIK